MDSLFNGNQPPGPLPIIHHNPGLLRNYYPQPPFPQKPESGKHPNSNPTPYSPFPAAAAPTLRRRNRRRILSKSRTIPMPSRIGRTRLPFP